MLKFYISMSEIIEAAVLIMLRDGANGLEALVGQNEVVNHLKRTQEKIVFMRFAGEYKFPGGTVEEGEDKEQAALREAREEFPGIALGDDTYTQLFYTYAEKRVNSGERVYNMSVYVFVQKDGNMSGVDVEKINQNLEERRRRYATAVHEGRYYSLDKHDKEALSPEVHEVVWKPLHEIIATVSNPEYVNSWQGEQFKRHGKTCTDREPIRKSAEVLKELQKYKTVAALIAYLQTK